MNCEVYVFTRSEEPRGHAEELGAVWAGVSNEDPRVEQIWDHIDSAGGKKGISLINNDLKTVVNGRLIHSITSSWNKSSIADGKLGVCAQKCGSEFDTYAEQFN